MSYMRELLGHDGFHGHLTELSRTSYKMSDRGCSLDVSGTLQPTKQIIIETYSTLHTTNRAS